MIISIIYSLDVSVKKAEINHFFVQRARIVAIFRTLLAMLSAKFIKKHEKDILQLL